MEVTEGGHGHSWQPGSLYLLFGVRLVPAFQYPLQEKFQVGSCASQADVCRTVGSLLGSVPRVDSAWEELLSQPP